VSTPVEVKNVVAGDLPFSGKGDFYLTVECGDNPPMSTSIAENCSPKVVHFSEILTLRVRDSPLEDQVRFVVKELNIFGSQEVAELRLSATRVCDWLRDAVEHGGTSGIMRFQMDPSSRSADMDTPPWLALEFAPPPEFKGPRGHYVHLFDTQTGVFKEPEKSSQFKQTYKLLDRTGEKQSEPNDDQIEKMKARRKAKREGACCTVCVVVCIIIAAVIFRLFLYKCWQEFTHLTVEMGIPNPDHEAVMAVCDNPPNNVRPMVFKKIAEEYNIRTLPCFKGVCHVRDTFVEYRMIFFSFLAVLVLILLYFLCRPERKKRQSAVSNDDDDTPRRGTQAGKGSQRSLAH